METASFAAAELQESWPDGDESARWRTASALELDRGELAVIPRDDAHEVEAAGDEPLRFLATYAAGAVVTTYELPVQPEGERRRSPF